MATGQSAATEVVDAVVAAAGAVPASSSFAVLLSPAAETGGLSADPALVASLFVAPAIVPQLPAPALPEDPAAAAEDPELLSLLGSLLPIPPMPLAEGAGPVDWSGFGLAAAPSAAVEAMARPAVGGVAPPILPGWSAGVALQPALAQPALAQPVLATSVETVAATASAVVDGSPFVAAAVPESVALPSLDEVGPTAQVIAMAQTPAVRTAGIGSRTASPQGAVVPVDQTDAAPVAATAGAPVPVAAPVEQAQPRSSAPPRASVPAAASPVFDDASELPVEASAGDAVPIPIPVPMAISAESIAPVAAAAPAAVPVQVEAAPLTGAMPVSVAGRTTASTHVIDHERSQALAEPLLAAGDPGESATVAPQPTAAPAARVEAFSMPRTEPTPRHEPNPVERAVAGQVSRAIVQHLPDGGARMVMRLTPPELGTVRVEFLMRDGAVTARLVAEDEGVRQALDRALPQLRVEVRTEHPRVDITVDRSDQRQAWQDGHSRQDQQRQEAQAGQDRRPRADDEVFSLDGGTAAVETAPMQRVEPRLGGRVTAQAVDAFA